MTDILRLYWWEYEMTAGTHEDWCDGSVAYRDGAVPDPSLAGIALNFMMRRTTTDPTVILSASNAPTINGLVPNGTVLSTGNTWAIYVPVSVMSLIEPRTYVWEMQAVAERTRIIASGPAIIVPGVVR